MCFRRVADATVKLHGFVGVVYGRLCRKHLRHAELSGRVVPPVSIIRCTQRQQSCGIYPLSHLANLPLDALKVTDGMVELFSLTGVRDRIIECGTCDSDATSWHVHPRLKIFALDIGFSNCSDSLLVRYSHV